MSRIACLSRGDHGAKLLLNQLIDFVHRRLPSFRLGALTKGRCLMLGFGHDLSRFDADLIQMLLRLAGHIIEVECHAGGSCVAIGGARRTVEHGVFNFSLDN